jgi:hypothetical protein
MKSHLQFSILTSIAILFVLVLGKWGGQINQYYFFASLIIFLSYNIYFLIRYDKGIKTNKSQVIDNYQIVSSILISISYTLFFYNSMSELAKLEKMIVAGINLNLILGIIFACVILIAQISYFSVIDVVVASVLSETSYFIVYYQEGSRKIVCNEVYETQDRYLLEINVINDRRKSFFDRKVNNKNVVALRKEMVNDIVFINKF